MHQKRYVVIGLLIAGVVVAGALLHRNPTAGAAGVAGQATPTVPPEPTPSTVDVVAQAWEDVNADGRYQPHEPPLVGARINLAAGECGAFPIFSEARATNEVGLVQFQVTVQEPTTLSLVAMLPDRMQATAPTCQSLTLEPDQGAPRPPAFGAYRSWSVAVHSSFLLVEERGDQMWVPVSDPGLAEQLQDYEAGSNLWYCGQVVAEPLLEWGFNFDPATAFMAEVTAEAQQTSIRFIAGDPESFEASDLPAWCIMVQAVADQANRSPAETVRLPFVTR